MAETHRPSKTVQTSPPLNISVAGLIQDQIARGEHTLSPLGQRLLAARRSVELSGVPLLNDQELEVEKAQRRGGVEHR